MHHARSPAACERGTCARQCASYAHVFPMAGSAPGRFLLPLLHLVNHDGAAPNIAVEKDAAAGAFKGVALRDIAAGEQVTYRRACAVQCHQCHHKSYHHMVELGCWRPCITVAMC